MAKKEVVEKEASVEVADVVEEPKVEKPKPKKETPKKPEPKVETPKPAKADKCECGGEANEIRNRKGKYIICLDCGLAK